MLVSSQLPVTLARGSNVFFQPLAAPAFSWVTTRTRRCTRMPRQPALGTEEETQATGNYYGKQMCVWERKRQNGSCPVERDICKEVKMARSWLRCVVCLPPSAMVIIGPGLLPRHVWVHGPAACLCWCPWLLTSPKTERIGLHRVGPAPHLLWH